MLNFEWPWLLLLLPLPVLIRLFIPPAGTIREAALRVPFIDDFVPEETGVKRRSYKWPRRPRSTPAW